MKLVKASKFGLISAHICRSLVKAVQSRLHVLTTAFSILVNSLVAFALFSPILTCFRLLCYYLKLSWLLYLRVKKLLVGDVAQ